MASRIVDFLFKTTAGRAVIVGCVVAGVAFGARIYYQEQSTPEVKRQKQSNTDQLDELVDALEAWSSEHGEGARPFPGDTPWTPSALECGRPAEVPREESSHPTWEALGLTFEGPTRYQWRFTATEEGYELLARTDNDCDGLYEVLRRSGSTGVTGVTSKGLKVDNPGD